jgi:RNA polymerase sigma-70 factor (ECF subfamily)
VVEQSDLELIEEVRAGSTAAFDALMGRYERLVYKVGFGYTGDRDDSMDLTQNVFLKVYRKLESFSGKGSFKSWLLRIAHNEGIDWVRKHARDRMAGELDEAIALRSEAEGDPDFVRLENREILTRAMDHLNPKQRQAIMLRYFDSLSVREVSSVLGCSEGTVKSLLFRSIRVLREQIVPQWSQS